MPFFTYSRWPQYVATAAKEILLWRRTWIARFPIGAICGLALSCVLTAPAGAQDLKPRSYTNMPIGQNFFGLGYIYSEGEVTPAPSVTLKDIEITVKATAAAYVHTFSLLERSASISVAWARLCQSGSGVRDGITLEADRCGNTDPGFRLAYMFYGAPAMDLATWRKNPTHRVIGISLGIEPPLGDYNNENLVNTGANRWTYKPEIGISNKYGKWNIEGSFGARLFSDNDNFLNGQTLEQDPLYQVQVHLIYNLPKGQWISLNSNYFWGGKTTRNGVKFDDRQENSRMGITYSVPLNQHHSLKFNASRGVVTNLGNDFDSVGVLWQYRWGAD